MYTTVTTTYDALSLSSVPTGMPTLPTGTYSLSIATPSVSHQSCLDTTSLYSAWSCALPLDSIDVSISPLVGGSKTGCYKIKIGSSDMPTGYNYGTQPPVIASEQILNLVNDTQQSQWGPAWYFEAAYDKLVVVPENALPPYNAKRDDDDHDNDNDLSRKGIAQTGDTPWFCFWNNTVLETFIYVNQTSRSGAQQASVSAASAPMATSTGATQGSYGSAYPTQPTASNGMQSSRTTTASSATTSQANYDNTVPGMLEDYPKVVKVEERRIPVGSRLPYCQKMVIQLDGSAVPALNSQGSEMFIYLNETEPALPAPSAKRSLPGTELVQRQTSQLCQCVWYSL
jgi:hypothetical protein